MNQTLSESLTSVTEEQKAKLSCNEVFENELKRLIEVTEPYYALEGIANDGDTIKAVVTKQLDFPNEPTGMSYSEAGRHLAILGSLAIANTNPVKEKHYYLATKADVYRVDLDPYDDIVHIGHMSTTKFNRRKAEATGYLTTVDGRIIYRITVEYSVLTTAVFERMFNEHKQETINNAQFNPYKDQISLNDIITSENCCTASLGTISRDVCVGHFVDYPALPVARIAQVLIYVAAMQKSCSENNLKQIRIKNVKVEAKSFIFAGETMDIRSLSRDLSEDYSDIIDVFAFKNNLNNDYAAKVSCFIE